LIIPLKMKRRSPIILEIPEMIPKYKEEYVNDVISKSIGFQLLK
jgi:vacuolar-type H+-ATPase subunit F/Vma7